MYESVHFISRKHAEHLFEPHAGDDRIIISVSSPETEVKTMTIWEELQATEMVPTNPAKLYLPSWKDVLRQEFHDAEPSATAKFRIYYDEKLAKEVIDFLAKHADSSIKQIFVHCDAGISRSAAIAKFAALKYNLYFDSRYSLYNRFVFSTLLKADGQIPSGAEDSAFALTTKKG